MAETYTVSATSKSLTFLIYTSELSELIVCKRFYIKYGTSAQADQLSASCYLKYESVNYVLFVVEYFAVDYVLFVVNYVLFVVNYVLFVVNT
eukprot:1179874-Prorocentrum_minimum.AAC.1